ncbi:hypothetical protein A2801_00465 [Candidatus Woesebacteria bacterium RIFCSPHIGHO2_01_FULL_41_10]|uniref:Uncharacterized protein n=1 Tax=Candidatus Woesebacteria bacterium RIFCSPHIGHO2_01_FULL_41_10 TaxID=1802500 RepID=A0A1F7YRV4_9BACT|nr:MAG: hypothetical protein A2801_00465 [Candidatus Woesebacteria bacterium RIFCSPHIGHO2_01_FULL_41_10]
MEPQSVNTQQQTVIAPASSPAPEVVSQTTAQTPSVIPNVKKLPKLNVPQMPKVSFRINKKIVIIIGVIMLLGIIGLVIMSVIGKQIKNGSAPVSPESSPSPTPSSEPGQVIVSPYANDPGVIAIEQQTDDLDAALRNINLREDTLRVPTLDWDVTF